MSPGGMRGQLRARGGPRNPIRRDKVTPTLRQVVILEAAIYLCGPAALEGPGREDDHGGGRIGGGHALEGPGREDNHGGGRVGGGHALEGSGRGGRRVLDHGFGRDGSERALEERSMELPKKLGHDAGCADGFCWHRALRLWMSILGNAPV